MPLPLWVTKRLGLSKQLLGNSVNNIAPVKGQKKRTCPLVISSYSSDSPLSSVAIIVRCNIVLQPTRIAAADVLQLYCECFVSVGTKRCHIETNIGQQARDMIVRILLRLCSLTKAIGFVSRNIMHAQCIVGNFCCV